MSFAFSPLGAAYLAMLLCPNLLWARAHTATPDRAAPDENRLLLTLERVGQASTTIAVLFVPAGPSPGPTRLACLGASLLAMVLYEVSWLRYFRTDRTDASLYRSLGPVPLPLAILPVVGLLLLAVYELHLLLVGTVVVLGVGHVGVHRGLAVRAR